MEKNLTVSDGEAVPDLPSSEVTPEADGTPIQTVYLSADPEQTALLQEILSELEQINEITTQQLAIAEAHSKDYVQGSLVICALIGFVAGTLIMKGLWSGKGK